LVSTCLLKPFSLFLTLNHQKLDVYASSRKFVLLCCRLTNDLPGEEKLGMLSQMRRAVLSVHLNIAEGASGKPEQERKRFMK
jgi:four helix bundle protein